MTVASPTADEWARRASALPLAFAQVREDPRLDLRIVSQLAARPVVVMIASGGETAIQVGRQQPAQLHLVDVNPAQLALTRLKWYLAQWSPVSAASALLGHSPMDPRDRGVQLEQILDTLDLASDVFGTLEQISIWGLDFSGRYERTFVELRSELSPITAEIHQALRASENCGANVALLDPSSPSGQIFSAAFDTVLSLDNLVCLFGQAATQNPRQPFAAHFAWRTRLSLAQHACRENPFLWQLLEGRFPSADPYDWLMRASKNQPLCNVHPELHCAPMLEVLQTFAPGSVDMVHLSNILDWLSPLQAEETLHQAQRVLKRGGRVIIRQLNSTLKISELNCRLEWDFELGRQLADQDRSFFYPKIFVGVRR